MKLEEILDEWEKDSSIDQFNLGKEIQKISQYHQKYLRWFVTERVRLKHIDSELRKLKLAKFEFFTQGETKETRELGWKLPARGVLIKSEADNYIEADEQVTELKMKYALQSEKVDALEHIIKALTNRGYNLKSAIEYERWKAGG